MIYWMLRYSTLFPNASAGLFPSEEDEDDDITYSVFILHQGLLSVLDVDSII